MTGWICRRRKEIRTKTRVELARTSAEICKTLSFACSVKFLYAAKELIVPFLGKVSSFCVIIRGIISVKCVCMMENEGYRQVLCANSFTSLAELSLYRAGKPALNYLVAEDRERVKGGEAACEALDVNSVFCYQPASSSCISMCFMLMYFFPPHWVPAT